MEGRVLEALNKALSRVRVADSYDVLYNFGGLPYRITSPDGYLQVDEVKEAELPSVLASTSTRLVFQDDIAALKAHKEEDVPGLLDQRLLQVQGDGGQFRALQQELGPHVRKLMAELHREVDIDDASIQALLKEVKQSEKTLLEEGNHVPGLVPASMVSRMVDGEPVTDYYTFSHKYMKPPNLKWLMFSALSTCSGNVGQTNYGAANIFMEMLTYNKRITCPFHEAITMQWGVVGGIGMRVKAFGSQDFMVNTVAESDYITLEDSRRILLAMTTMQLGIENVIANIFDAAAKAMFLGQQPPSGEGMAVSPELPRHSEWSVQGGGLAHVGQRDQLHDTLATETKEPAAERATEPAKAAHLIAGTWDDWVAHKMSWDPAQGCHVFKVRIRQPGAAGFQVVRDTTSQQHATKPRKLRCTRPAFTIKRSAAGELWEVRLFLKEGGIAKKVDWVSHGIVAEPVLAGA
mmetsp:Transcript_49652/g.91667  ORF Transcript_49652/g.91667 Transcript_49652/m.91667 type:complete len:462 (-) Transcript_49652:67-1452(-)